MTEHRAADPEDRDTETETRTDQDKKGDEISQQAASLRKRGAVARPQAENPAAVEPKTAANQ